MRRTLFYNHNRSNYIIFFKPSTFLDLSFKSFWANRIRMYLKQQKNLTKVYNKIYLFKIRCLQIAMRIDFKIIPISSSMYKRYQPFSAFLAQNVIQTNDTQTKIFLWTFSCFRSQLNTWLFRLFYKQHNY